MPNSSNQAGPTVRRQNVIVRILLLLICAELLLPLYRSNSFAQAAATPPPATAASTSNAPLVPSPLDGIIATTTADMLKECHYLHLVFDDKLSDKFLTEYLNTIDPQHLHFLQSDLDEFNKFRPNLGDLTRQGNTSPAYTVFNRYRQRLDERTAYSLELLKNGPLDFTTDEQMALSRKTAPYAKDLNEAHQLWRQRLLYDYLQEKLGRDGPTELARLTLGRHNAFAQALIWHDLDHEITQVISRRYTRTVRNFKDWESDKVLETYLTALCHVYDPHTDYFDKSDLENFAIQISNTLFGIGATLQMSEDGYTTIVDLIPSGPAAKSRKLKVKDRIVAVAQDTNEPVDVVDMPLNHVVEKIRGTKGTEVRLTIIPAGAVDPSTRVTVPLVRDEINLEDQAAKAQLIEMTGANGKPVRLGVIDLPSFYASFLSLSTGNRPETIKSTTRDVARLLIKLKSEGVSGVILDLRRNGGGSLDEAINVTGLFIKPGPVVQVRSSDGGNDIKEDHEPPLLYDGPLIVLTSRLSASASEIVAGALQDYDRALIVGDKSTHGKGTVQSMSQLARYISEKISSNIIDGGALGALKYTTNKFYRINGSSTQLRGVEADIALPSTYDYMDMLGETSLENALGWDTNTSADYEKLNCVQPFLPGLKTLSAARVASDKDFAYVREDIEQVKKLNGDKSISLNERKRVEEGQADEARQKARDEELKNRKWPDEKIYEITLKQADLPGLPPPLIITNGVVDTNAFAPVKTAVLNNPASTDSTNSATVAADESTPKPPVSPADMGPEDRAPLQEAERILMDYISVWNPQTALASKQTEKLAPN